MGSSGETLLNITKNKKDITEKLALIAGVLQPLMTIPQVIAIFSSKDSGSVSLTTWIGYAVLGLAFLVYGIAHHLRPIWVTQTIWLVLQLSVVIGILLYD